jgi:hypothetical protein
MSVAKICTRGTAVSVSMCSRSRMAMEKTSSPVEQPGTQTRTTSSAPRPSKSFGTTSFARLSKASAVAEEVGDVDQQVAEQGADLARILPQPFDIGLVSSGAGAPACAAARAEEGRGIL